MCARLLTSFDHFGGILLKIDEDLSICWAEDAEVEREKRRRSCSWKRVERVFELGELALGRSYEEALAGDWPRLTGAFQGAIGE